MFNSAALQRAAVASRQRDDAEFDRQWCPEHDAWDDQCGCYDAIEAALERRRRRNAQKAG